MNVRQHGRVVRVDGAVLDFPPAEYGFQRYDHHTRSNMMASHRLGFRQKQAIGEVFWTHPLVPNRAFPTSTRALLAALRTVAPELSAAVGTQEGQP